MTKFQRTFYVLLIAFVSILSVSGTIALRNVLHLALMVMLSIYAWSEMRRNRDSVIGLTKAVPVAVVLWCAYLLAFPLIAPDGQGAMQNLMGKGMWGESILTWILAWGSVLVLGVRHLGLWQLALASAAPVFIHLLLLLLAWAGVLQPGFYAEPSLEQVWFSLAAVAGDASLLKNSFQTFPIGFRGIEPMHGNLGYPASQATCLALAVAYSAWRNGKNQKMMQAIFLIAACFASVVIAQSRAAAYFGLLLVALSFLVHRLTSANRHVQRRRVQERRMPSVRVGMVTSIILVVCLTLFAKIATSNVLWYSMWDKLAVAWELDNPMVLLCEGLDVSVNDKIRSKYADKDEAYIVTLLEGVRGDGARVLLARAGFELTEKYPWGLNAGRDAYQIRMAQACGRPPAMEYSHAHNAWVNLALALGVLGAFIYCLMLLKFAATGLRMFRSNGESSYYGFALFLLAVFWLLRGMTDAVFQEHYLQMQAFMLLVLPLLGFSVQANQALNDGTR